MLGSCRKVVWHKTYCSGRGVCEGGRTADIREPSLGAGTGFDEASEVAGVSDRCWCHSYPDLVGIGASQGVMLTVVSAGDCQVGTSRARLSPLSCPSPEMTLSTLSLGLSAFSRLCQGTDRSRPS